MIDLSVSIGALKLQNPVLTASGTFGYAEEFEGLIDFRLLGGIVTKTVTLEPRPGNPPPRIVELPNGMLNSIGLPNVGVERFIAEKMPYLRRLGTRLIVNVAGRTGEDFVECVRRLEAADGIDAYELNFSCPNVKEGGLSFSSDAHVAGRVTAAVRAVTNRPLITKLTPNVTSISDIGLACQDAGADAVSAVNTLVGMAVDIRTRRAKLATVTGGYSGPAIKPIALAKVYELARRLSIPVIGIGGICSAEDIVEFLLAGATAVQMGTVNFYDPTATVRAVEDLEKFCRAQNVSAVRTLIGAMEL
ncbi:MAG: dihydroorotate dehydrogenase [candidate division KSB1 bacterium]|nr:dihydroorotate dehydrogenase [candidate division KSB1 bacterium]